MIMDAQLNLHPLLPFLHSLLPRQIWTMMEISMSTDHFPSENVFNLGRGLTMVILHGSPDDLEGDDTKVVARNYIRADADPFSVPPHWHATHVEMHRVLRGKLQITVGDVTKIYGPEDGWLKVPTGVVHSMKGVAGIDTISEETTEPFDGEKETFFRDLLYYKPFQQLNLLYVANVFYYEDSIPAFPRGLRWLEIPLLTLLGKYLAPIFGQVRTSAMLEQEKKNV